jgi:hypothetical protein
MPVLASDVVAHARGEMLTLRLTHDEADNAGTKLGISRQLDGDIAQEGVAITRRDRTGGKEQAEAIKNNEPLDFLPPPTPAPTLLIDNALMTAPRPPLEHARIRPGSFNPHTCRVLKASKLTAFP